MVASVAALALLLAGVAVAAWKVRAIDVPLVREEDDEPSDSPSPGVPNHLCTLIGCADPAITAIAPGDLSLYPTDARRVLLCVAETCHLSELRDRQRFNQFTLPIPYRRLRPVRVEIHVQDRKGTTLDRDVAHGMLRHDFPNGRECAPECIYLFLAYDPVRGRLSPSRAAFERLGLPAQAGLRP